MLIAEARVLDLRVAVLDPDPEAPCASLADRFWCGGLDDPSAIARLVDECAVTTWEIEHINVDAVAGRVERGAVVRPDPNVLRIVQDKAAQRRRFSEAGLPGPRWCEFSPEGDAHLQEALLIAFGLPAVQKLRRGGYDGRGVTTLRAADTPRLPGPSILEELVEIEYELAVLVARALDGSTVCYDPVQMRFDPVRNICTHVIAAPSELSPVAPEIAREARRIAEAAVTALDGVGIFGVELFVEKGSPGRVLLNEVAPRPHNSGHYTIDACATSQFAQHLRAVLGLPLGSPEIFCPAVMVNLLGEGKPGPVAVDGLDRALSLPGVTVHLYGKRRSAPGRKMGHLTAIGATVAEALDRADRAAGCIQIHGAPSPEGGHRG
ncbi:MAG: 5-(carboxyamino)imidazole ribonucleotide synthase [Spirochaetaceae bacterium]|nr:MAG: 5-(carboxyamino)imidazole ribonucleotide synthase [Spirochaetaceae bacterium]